MKDPNHFQSKTLDMLIGQLYLFFSVDNER